MKTWSFQEAFDLAQAAAVPLPAEHVPLGEAAGRVLAEDVRIDHDLPPFDKSAMDGFACRRADLGQVLAVVEDIPAGCMPTRTIGAGECARIMTGAPVPAGAECVVMVEKTERLADGRVRLPAQTAENICRRGEDVRDGSRVLTAGAILTPAHVAVLAAAGCARPRVARRPRVTLLATGSELVEVDCRPAGAQIRNSNTPQLQAQLAMMGIAARYAGIVPDTAAATDDGIRQALVDTDVLMLSGGVSAGDFDFVPGALQRNGFTFLFESVAMQPGRPTVFGRRAAQYGWGLPGNPVSTFVVFEILIKPFLYRLMGAAWNPPPVRATLARAVRRRGAERQATLPVRFVAPGVVDTVEYHGSAHIGALTQAEALLTVPAGQEALAEGATVHVRPL